MRTSGVQTSIESLQTDRLPLTLWQRLKYAWMATVAIVGVACVMNIVLSGLGRRGTWDFAFSLAFHVPVFAAAFIAAPLLDRYVPYRRRK